MHYRPEEEREALDALVQDVQRLAMNESRIMQRRGLLLWRLWCEVKEGDARKRLGGTAIVAFPPGIIRFDVEAVVRAGCFRKPQAIVCRTSLCGNATFRKDVGQLRLKVLNIRVHAASVVTSRAAR
jgi:hypothetical protein